MNSPLEYDVIAFGAHPDDLEAVMGGTAAKLADKGRSVLFVGSVRGEPGRRALRRSVQGAKSPAGR
jgi:LmbE family N-acetylglucosaminyl deacetylase